MATEAERLRAEVEELRLAVTGLAAVLDEKVQTKVETEVKAKAVPREELTARLRASGKRTLAGLALVVILAGAAVGANRLTLIQAQDRAIGDFRRLVETCRTTGPPLSAADRAFCNIRVPGFDQARQRVLDTAATAKRNQERLARLEDKVAKLKQ